MANGTTRLPRLTDRKVEVQQQLITFEIRGVGFLMPIEAVHRAIVFDYDDSLPLRYINFEQNILPVIAVESQILNRPAEALPPASPDPALQQIALIVEALSGPAMEQEHRIALPIDSPPSLCRMAESDLLPLPKTYEVQCVDGMTKANADQPLQFLLNPHRLVESQIEAQLSPQQLASLMTSSQDMVVAEPLGL